jgi:parallel beta-helix repeat protein
LRSLRWMLAARTAPLSLAMLILLTAVDVVPAAAAPLLRRLPRQCRGVDVGPSDNLQAMIDNHPRGTTFCFRRGTYELSRTISTGSKHPLLDFRSGAIFDGGRGGFAGIQGGGAVHGRGTVILGGIFQHFGSANAPSWISSIVMNDRWLVRGTEFRDNFNTGLTIQGSGARATGIHTHHNGRYGLVVTGPCAGCPAPRNIVIQRSEIAFNNTRRLPTLDDAGGTKFSGGPKGMIVRRNEVHDNFGSGLWWDTVSQDARVYNNVIYDNRNWGIFWEASYGGTKIHDNTLINNGVGDGTLDWGANVQLLVSNSDGSIGGGIAIYDNRISGTAIPIGLLNHTEGRPGTTHVYIHHNVMTLRANSALVGGTIHFGDPGLFSPEANNRFEYNAYRVRDRGGSYWKWNGKTLTWPEWQGVGHDEDGTLRLLA